MASPESLGYFYMQRSAAAIAHNVGFSTANDRALNILAALMKQMFVHTCQRCVDYARHGTIFKRKIYCGDVTVFRELLSLK